MISIFLGKKLENKTDEEVKMDRSVQLGTKKFSRSFENFEKRLNHV
jgi:hypothetical protein